MTDSDLAAPAETPWSQPYRYEVDARCADLVEEFAGLAAETTTERRVSVAGRLMLRRAQGKLAFATLADSSGRIQLFAPAASTPDFDAFTKLSLGDWIGVRGVVMTTRRGELSVRVDEWVVLARTQRPFPDKWHGISDPDMRYRQRYVDLWVTDEARRTFQLRSRVLSEIRRFMESRGFMEVETPIFHPIPGGALARPFTTHHNALDAELFLRIAPELYLKRLVVGGFERVFEIARVFRNEGLSPRHNPEFTMLEWYQAYADYRDAMALMEELVSSVAVATTGSSVVSLGGREIDLTPPWPRRSMVELIKEHAGLDVDASQPLEHVRSIARDAGVKVESGYGPGKLVLEIYEKTTEPHIWGPVFVVDHPKEVSPLAREHRDDPTRVERFEPIVAGRELGNGFSELTDAAEQRHRFEEQAAAKEAGDDEAMIVDDDYLRALEYGLPPTAGVGVGIDRLVMLLAEAASIRDVLLFPTLRPEA
jgi:lysyl-tRNA synthetase class 2